MTFGTPKFQSGSEWDTVTQSDDNMIVKLEWRQLEKDFLHYLQASTTQIQGVLTHHLYLRSDQICTVAAPSEWLKGSFNVCIPISISNWRKKRVMLRCPLPYKLEPLPVNGVFETAAIEEKIRCEAGAFAWISQNCKQVPIPHLWGFGLPDGSSFTAVEHIPWHLRMIEYIKQLWAHLCRKDRYVPFIRRKTHFGLRSGYMIVEFIEQEQGEMLSWPPKSSRLKENFYKSLSRVMLDLAGHPLERIGSFTVQDSGRISLSNRPLTFRLPLLESEGIPTYIPRTQCYTSTDTYLNDLHACLGSKLQHQPNSVYHDDDAKSQLAILTILRALSQQFTQHQLRDGPFVFTLTDLHPGNIFVDKEYNITSIPDLEWGCSLPIEWQSPPLWITGSNLDQIPKDDKDFLQAGEAFLDILDEEDTQNSKLGSRFFAKVTRAAWEKKTHWFVACLNYPRATHTLFIRHIQSVFAPEQVDGEEGVWFDCAVYRYWRRNAAEFVKQKVADQAEYQRQLRALHHA